VKTSGCVWVRVTSLAYGDSSLCEGTVAKIMREEVSCGFHFPEGSLWANLSFIFPFFSLGHTYRIVNYVPEPLLRRGQSPDHFSNIYRFKFG